MGSENQALVVSGQQLTDTMQIGDIFAASGFFQDSKTKAQAITKILAGQELGVPPVAAMTQIYLVQGKVTLSAKLQAAQIKRSGRYNFKVRWLENPLGCEIEILELNRIGVPASANQWESVGKSVFTMKDAEKAGLLNGPNKANWEKYTRNMLWSRAMSNAAGWYCSEIFSGAVYTPEELDMEVDGEGTPIDPPQVPVTITDVTPRPERTSSPGHVVEGEVIQRKAPAPAAAAEAEGVRVKPDAKASAWEAFCHSTDELLHGRGIPQSKCDELYVVIDESFKAIGMKPTRDNLRGLYTELKDTIRNVRDLDAYIDARKPAVPYIEIEALNKPLAEAEGTPEPVGAGVASAERAENGEFWPNDGPDA